MHGLLAVVSPSSLLVDVRHLTLTLDVDQFMLGLRLVVGSGILPVDSHLGTLVVDVNPF
jgi:hypothetical protein